LAGESKGAYVSNEDNANICKIALSEISEFCVVDIADQVLVAPFKWRILRGRNTTYVRTWMPGIGDVLMHHYLLGGIPPNGFVVDHVNGNGLDNRRVNLQVITNGDNISKSGRTGYGISYLKRLKSKPWKVELKVEGARHHVGYFATEEEALAARNAFLIARGKEVRTLDN